LPTDSFCDSYVWSNPEKNLLYFQTKQSSTMKNFTSTLRFFVFAFLMGFFQAANGQAYQKLEDASGFNTDAFQAELEAAAQALQDSFPTDFQDDFKVYDFGFYLHQEVTDGGYPEAFAQKVAAIAQMSRYYLVFGKQTDQSGIYSKYWVDLKLPTTGEFTCLDLFAANYRTNLTKKFEIIANQIAELNDYSPSMFATIEKGVIDSLKSYLTGMYECCDPSQRTALCNTCPFSESQFADYLSEEVGLFESSCKIVKKVSNVIPEDPNMINRIIEEDGDIVNVDVEINNLISNFQIENPGKTVKVFRFKFPSNCAAFEAKYLDYLNDPSDSKMIIGLIGSIGGDGSLFWQSFGTTALHKLDNGFGYSVKKRNDGGFDISLTTTLKIINLTDDVLVSAQNLRDEIIVYSDIFNGDFSMFFKNKNLSCNGNLKIICNAVDSKIFIKDYDMILGIVDKIPQGQNFKFEPAGFAQKSGLVGCVNKEYRSKHTCLHEFGHLLGLDDAYPTPTVMGDVAHGKCVTTPSQRRDIYQAFPFKPKEGGEWRNRWQKIGITTEELKLFLDDNDVEYDKSKL
jgi:hypothetical protein